jgi:hypothetical protein
MNKLSDYRFVVCLLLMIFIIGSCDEITQGDLESSLEKIEKVEPIEGADRSTVIVNRSHSSFFSLELRGISEAASVMNGVAEGWCIDWQKPINSDNGVYENIQLYSTFRVEKWKPTNYLLNILPELKESFSGITYREIQAIIWSLQGFPEFDLKGISIEDLPARLKNNGEPNFSYETVFEIIDLVEAGYKGFEFSEGTKYAVIAETPADVQTVIAVFE